MNTPLLIIGAGNMGSAFANALLKNKIIHPQDMMVCDPDRTKLNVFAEAGCMVSSDAVDLLSKAKTIILAIKPQGAKEILFSWRKYLMDRPDIISLLAGTNVPILQSATLCPIIRLMPNLPMLVGSGVFGYYFDESFDDKKKEKYRAVFSSIATAIECDIEDKIDAITALSGSGPAYYFFLMEQMQEKAQKFGFDEENSKMIALQTLIGAGLLAKDSELSFSVLRQNVTSKGGTTEAAVSSFDKNNLANIWKTGMQSAYERAKELS